MQQIRWPGTFFGPPDLVELLRHRATFQPDDIAFTFLVDGENEQVHVSNAELDRQARAIGGWLQSMNLAGERALLLYPPGLEFIAAFFGCVYAGVVAVPVYPPRRNRSLLRIEAISDDAQAKVALTTDAVLRRVESLIDDTPHLKQLRWLATCHVPPGMEDRWQKPPIDSETLAFLQYTSGSTGIPKGVMLNHGNLLHNSALIAHVFEHTRSGLGVFWLPSYHDMGLIGGILQPLYVGRPNILMSPVAFLQKPFRWLSAITRFGATTSGGPNFAYELCVQKISPAQRAQLDLSSWQVAFNGAEPVREETLERFAEAFEPYGFRWEAFFPCYGLAEATLIVTGGYAKKAPVVRWFEAETLSQGEAIVTRPRQPGARPLVGCGQCLPDQRVIIVNPETCTPCPDGVVGEIWVQGPSVAMGYWQRPEDTQHTFRAYLATTGEGPFLRTGDLGFIRDGELFVTGRIKDVIILRGVNFYPQDIELTVQNAHPWLRADAGAAFAVEMEDEQRLVVVHELERRVKGALEPVFQAIRRAINEEHDLAVDTIVLLKPGSIPKTTSNKIQRHACRAAFLSGTLNMVASWSRRDKTEKIPASDEVFAEQEAVSSVGRVAASGPVAPAAGASGNLKTVLVSRKGPNIGGPSNLPTITTSRAEHGAIAAEPRAAAADGDDGNGHSRRPSSARQSSPAKAGSPEPANGDFVPPDASAVPPSVEQPSEAQNRAANGKTTIELVLEQVRRVAKDRAVNLTLDQSISELGLDSLERMEIIAGLQEQLGGRIPEEVLPQLDTCRQVVEAVERYLRKSPGSAGPEFSQIGPEQYRIDQFPESVKLQQRLLSLRKAGLDRWQYPVLDGGPFPQVEWQGRSLVHWASFNYLGLSTNPVVLQAAQEALERWGVGVSASRLTAGQRPIHAQLEEALAALVGAESALVFACEYSAVSSTIHQLLGPQDTFLYQRGIAPGFLHGAQQAGAQQECFPRGDWKALEEWLIRYRPRSRRIVVAIEGLSPVDGSIAELPPLSELCRRYQALLVVDESHSVGVLGDCGRGLREYWHSDSGSIDLCIGSLGHALGSAGGFVAGCRSFIQLLRSSSPAMTQATALAPSLSAAALAAIQQLTNHPELIQKLRERSILLRGLLQSAGIPICGDPRAPAVPVITGSSAAAISLARRLQQQGFFVLPTIYPSVEERQARIRLMCSAAHDLDQVRQLAQAIIEAWPSLKRPAPLPQGASPRVS